jgi:hypothetical protein
MGKPLGVAGGRMFLEPDGSFRITRYQVAIASVSIDNVLTVHDLPSGHAGTFLWTVFSLASRYIGKDKYRVWLDNERWKLLTAYIHRNNAPEEYTKCWTEKEQYVKTRPLAFMGIKFDLGSGECINPRTDPKRVRVADKFKQWQDALREYQKGWRVRAKIGAIRAAVESHITERTDYSEVMHMPMEELVRIVREQDYDRGAAKVVSNCISWWALRDMCKTGRWTVDDAYIEQTFKRVYETRRDALLVMLGAVKIEQHEVLNPSL